jgi:hypothetical protein
MLIVVVKRWVGGATIGSDFSINRMAALCCCSALRVLATTAPPIRRLPRNWPMMMGDDFNENYPVR